MKPDQAAIEAQVDAAKSILRRLGKRVPGLGLGDGIAA